MAPSTSISWLCQAPIRFTMRWAAYALSTEPISSGAVSRMAGRRSECCAVDIQGVRIAADTAAESHQQSRVDCHQVGSADDRFGHVLCQRDASGDDQCDFIPHSFIHQPAVNLAEDILDMPAGKPGLCSLTSVLIRAKVKNLESMLR